MRSTLKIIRAILGNIVFLAFGLVFLYAGRLLFGADFRENSRFSYLVPFARADAPIDSGDGLDAGGDPEGDGSGAAGGDSSGEY